MTPKFYGCMAAGSILVAWICAFSATQRPQGVERRLEMLEGGLAYIVSALFMLLAEYVARNPR